MSSTQEFRLNVFLRDWVGQVTSIVEDGSRSESHYSTTRLIDALAREVTQWATLGARAEYFPSHAYRIVSDALRPIRRGGNPAPEVSADVGHVGDFSDAYTRAFEEVDNDRLEYLRLTQFASHGEWAEAIDRARQWPRVKPSRGVPMPAGRGIEAVAWLIVGSQSELVVEGLPSDWRAPGHGSDAREQEALSVLFAISERLVGLSPSQPGEAKAERPPRTTPQVGEKFRGRVIQKRLRHLVIQLAPGLRSVVTARDVRQSYGAAATLNDFSVGQRLIVRVTRVSADGSVSVELVGDRNSATTKTIGS